jgi:hypothetical protein
MTRRLGLAGALAVLALAGDAGAQAPPRSASGEALDTVRFGQPSANERGAKAVDLDSRAAPTALPKAAPGIVLTPEPATVTAPPAAAPETTRAARDRRSKADRQAGDVRQIPMVWTGRFFAERQGRLSTCSASFIAPQVFVTAAHCVRNQKTGQDPERVAFALQYERGKFSQLYFPACMAIWPGWVSPDANLQPGELDVRKAQFDYAMFFVPQASRTGHLGFHVNWLGAYGEGTRIGYPGKIDGGETIQVVNGPLMHVKELPRVVAIRDNNPNMSQGSSGGPWIAEAGSRAGAGNRLISVTSFGSDGMPGVAFGPYIDADFVKMFTWVSNGCR